jgi:hypothetical protein
MEQRLSIWAGWIRPAACARHGYGERIDTTLKPLPERTGQQRKPLTRLFRSSKDEKMRDFRDAKAMAHSLREALAAKDLRITNSESLELISRAFGTPDWNTLSAAIQTETSVQATSASPAPPQGRAWPIAVPYAKELAGTLQSAKADAKRRGHHFLTLEHVLLALLDDPDGADAMQSCSVDTEALRSSLMTYIDTDLRSLGDLEKLKSGLAAHLDSNVLTDRGEPTPTAGLARAVQVAQRRAALAGKPAVTGSDVVAAVFLNAGDCQGANLLESHGMSRRSALGLLSAGLPDAGGTAAA